MDIAATVATAKKVYKVAKKLKTILEIDQNKRIIIKRDFVAGTFVREVPDFRCVDFVIVDRVMLIFRTGDREPICDSVSLAPDKILDFDIVVSSVVHDCIYKYLELIAKAWGWPVDDVRELADNAFGCDMLARARTEKNAIKRAIYVATAHIYHAAVRLFGGIYHNAKKGAGGVAVLLLFSACNIPPDFISSGAPLDYVITNIAARVESAEKPHQPSVDAIDYSLLDWRYGGFNGSGAVHNPNVVIKDLKINKSGMSYAWQSGGCEQLGAKGRSDAACIAALFCLVDGKWIGGKFEWISTSRLTRSWHNIDGYNGWSMATFNAASKYAFVIVSRDGRHRSNIIVNE